MDVDPTPDQVEEALLAYRAARVDLSRLSDVIRHALAAQTDDHANSMLRRGAEILVQPMEDGTAYLILAYTETAEAMAAMRAAAWDGEYEQPPAPGSDERGKIVLLYRFVTGSLAAVPRG